jgi:hypothetical protein
MPRNARHTPGKTLRPLLSSTIHARFIALQPPRAIIHKPRKNVSAASLREKKWPPRK